MSKISKAIETRVHKFDDGTVDVDSYLRLTNRTRINPHIASEVEIDFTISNSRKKMIYEVYGDYIHELAEINAMLWGDGDYRIRYEVSDRLIRLMNKMKEDENDGRNKSTLHHF